MGREFNHNKLEELCDFVIEVSKGNFTLQVDPKNSGELTPLVMLHNIMNEELNTLFHISHGGKSHPEVNLISILAHPNLDNAFISSSTMKLIHMDQTPKRMNSILTPSSYEKLYKSIQKRHSWKKPAKKLNIDFITGKGLILKTTAVLEIVDPSDNNSLILINAYNLEYKNDKLEKYRRGIDTIRTKYPSRNRSMLLQENREMIESLQRHLIQTLDQKFPGMKALAEKFNASESKLKKGFKHYYHISIYKFLQQKRFEKAHLLLTQTEKPVSTIARECGFVSAAHFSRSFKEKFGYRPTDVQRRPE
ncbi:AraC family transcriptional regulator [Gramella sp. GC03-9]|uniref:AraC family transcriptional regulator n=1 Tax=Christiangramia oceanisediminis TaxID=2920386 RepID=A0A9X2KZY2_9FLAO|nr:AraC family transcriptional regulator [Gramella oceanisediminis]MCP9201314.1 AraC family transcriptional regulator [Gramella oceanisediminis]